MTSVLSPRSTPRAVLYCECPWVRRTGKCKERTRCKYVHDSSKVAVCPKWLQGRCADDACPLQHQLRPELMPVCSFFLQVCSLGRIDVFACMLSAGSYRVQMPLIVPRS